MTGKALDGGPHVARGRTARKRAQVLKDSDFNWEDPLDLEGDLTEEERMVRDTARGFAQDKLMPRVSARLARGEGRSSELLPEMGALGLLGPTIPEEYGGAGLGYVAYGLIAREIGARRFRLSLDHVGAVVAGDASDLRLRHRGAAAANICPSSPTAS